MNKDTYAMGLGIWARWTDMWNGTLEIALELAADPFVLHLIAPAETDPKTVSTPAKARDWVAESRKKYTKITFITDAGPFVDTVARVVAGPWVAEAIVDGKTHYACGMDTVAFDADGKITEYWTMSKPSENPGDWNKSSTVRHGAPPQTPRHR